MNWTVAIAAVGAVTGAASLTWQFVNYKLTGGRVQVLATYLGNHERAKVWASIVNAGRLDVSIMGYTVWADIPGHRFRKMRWRIKAARRVGLGRTSPRVTLVTFAPSVHFQGPVEFGDDVRSVELPAVLAPGSMLKVPAVWIGWSGKVPRRIRVAVHLGSGRIVRSYPIDGGAFKPLELKLYDEGFTEVKTMRDLEPSVFDPAEED